MNLIAMELFQIITTEKRWNEEKLCFVISHVINKSGNDYQWILKPLAQRILRNRTTTCSQIITSQIASLL